MNPRAAINDLHPFQGCPFGQLGYFSKTERVGFEPTRPFTDKRFSRPPRYDHFDTSPSYIKFAQNHSAKVILAKMFSSVNNFFSIITFFRESIVDEWIMPHFSCIHCQLHPPHPVWIQDVFPRLHDKLPVMLLP